jgi:uncharacterized protein (DUF2164 family)
MPRRKTLEFPKEQLHCAKEQLIAYAADQLELELNGLQAQLLLKHFAEEYSGFFYNIGIDDAMRFMAEKVDDMYALRKG